MNTAVLCLGGNLGFRVLQLEEARNRISKTVGPILKTSAYYETAPWGGYSKNNHINQCLIVETKLSAPTLITTLLKIESDMGRVRGKKKNTDRIIDIDLLFFNDAIINTPELILPHPRLHLRQFVLKPLMDIAPGWRHPVLGKTIRSLFRSCKDELSVVPFIPKPIYICVEGNIGSGKSTLAEALAKQWAAGFVPEKFEQNALLPLFYTNPNLYGFPLEYSFLIDRFQQLHSHFSTRPMLTVSDYSLYKCLLFAHINLRKQDYLFYKKHFNALAQQIPKPDVVLFIDSPVINLQKNIARRGRTYEKGIQKNYLQKITTAYKTSLPGLYSGKVITLSVKNYTPSTLSDLLLQTQNNCSF